MRIAQFLVMGILMDGLQQQINELNQKVTQLHHIVEQLSLQMGKVHLHSEAVVNEKLPIQSQSMASAPPSVPPSVPKTNHYQSVMEHKDILLDDRESHTLIAPEEEPLLTTDLQVRRLTAQLTAAYNRIAALEEQLLACRMMP
ncbi:MAG: hypothetical protein AB4044_22385 [Crocosphaera sp.]|nr:hypothetical protein [Crocosphaera sp.]